MCFYSYYGALITCSLVQPDALSKHGFDALLRESVWVDRENIIKNIIKPKVVRNKLLIHYQKQIEFNK